MQNGKISISLLYFLLRKINQNYNSLNCWGRATAENWRKFAQMDSSSLHSVSICKGARKDGGAREIFIYIPVCIKY